MKEATSARLDIADSTAEVVEATLRHIYTGNIEPEHALCVLHVAPFDILFLQ